MEEGNKFNRWYDEELSMISSSYPLARTFITQIKELLKGTEEEKFITPISQMPENFPEILGLVKPDKFVYFSEEEKERYRVYFYNNCLCHFVEGIYISIDSDVIFRNFFDGRNYLEDEEFLAQNGYPIPEIRHAKAKRSCFVLDLSDNLYIFPYRSNTIHHSSLTRGKPIKLAGSVEVNNGKISYIDNSTGHYQSNYKLLIKIISFIYRISGLTDLSNLFSEEFNCDSIGILRHNGESKFAESEIANFKAKFISSIKSIETSKFAHL